MSQIYVHPRWAFVDDVDWLWLAGYQWNLTGKPGKSQYAATKVKGLTSYMHKMIAERMGLLGEIDHEDHNTLNNQRSNFRPADRSHNIANSSIRKSKTGFKGVYQTPVGRFAVEATVNYLKYYIGTFDTAIEGAKAYNDFAIKHWGKYAHLNTIPSELES
jgi:AP2 domain